MQRQHLSMHSSRETSDHRPGPHHETPAPSTTASPATQGRPAIVGSSSTNARRGSSGSTTSRPALTTAARNPSRYNASIAPPASQHICTSAPSGMKRPIISVTPVAARAGHQRVIRIVAIRLLVLDGASPSPPAPRTHKPTAADKPLPFTPSPHRPVAITAARAGSPSPQESYRQKQQQDLRRNTSTS